MKVIVLGGAGDMGSRAVEDLVRSAEVRRVIGRLIDWLEAATRGPEPDWGAVRVDAWGERKGKPVHRMLCGIGQMREATGISLAIGTIMLARKQLLTEAGGVYAPAACLDPLPFIQAMKAKGLQAFHDLEMKEPVT